MRGRNTRFASVSSSKRICSLLLLSAALALFLPRLYGQQDGGTVITIQSAQKTEYVRDGDEEIIVLTGGVELSVENGGDTVSISASSVTFNRSTDMLSAKGGVTLLQTSGGSSSGETVYAESLLLSTKTMEGVFDGARVFQTQGRGINLPAGSTLVVSADLFGRDSSGTIAFKNGELSFCEDDDPHWKIKASRIWLLPGEEFAFLNAVLSIGNVPVLYLPAFYYPKDELLFHPVFGYDMRRGYGIQTTTYLYGRKPLSSESSSSGSGQGGASDIMDGIFSFMKPATLKEQRREGLVLHNLDEDFTGSTGEYVKLLGDYYSTLGGLLGVDASLAPSVPGMTISSLSARVLLGFSSTVFSLGSAYTQYAPSGTVYYNRSSFLGLSLPFRYNAELSAAITAPFRLSLSLPVYSDPFFEDDFGDRSEDMDWFAFLMSSTAQPSTESSGEVSSFAWNLSASYTVPLPDAVKPYISSLSLSSLSSSVQFSSRQNGSLSTEDFLSTYSPARKFFYPSLVTPVNVSVRMSGTLAEYPRAGEKARASAKSAVPLDAPPGFSLSDTSPPAGSDDDADAEEGTLLFLPDLPVSPDLSVQSFPGLSYRLSYALSPSAVTQIQYDGTTLSSPDDFDWNDIQSMYVQMKSPLEVTGLLSFRSSFLSVRSTLSFNPVFQDHPDTSGYSDSAAAAVHAADYAARKLDVTGANTVSIRPLIYFPMLKNTGLDWSTSLKLLRTSFAGTVTDPDWDFLPLDVTDRESFSVHTLSATLSAQETDSFGQTLVLTTALPPQLELYKASLALGFPYVSAGLSAGVQKKSDDSDEWTLQPLQQTLSVKLFPGTGNQVSLSQSFSYSLEDEHPESFRLSLSWRTLSASYTMQHTYGYDFDGETGWTMRSEKEFLPVSVSLSYSLDARTYRFWRNRVALTPSLSTSLVYDCLRPTSSSFVFSPSLTFRIHEFLDLSFSAQTRNDVIYRYFQNLSPRGIQIPGETNLFADLLNSFAFWGDGQFFDPAQTKRKSSGFKLKSLSVKVSHELHDWKLSAEFSVSPRLTTSGGRKAYSFDPYFALSVVWKPLPGMRTQLTDNYGTWEFR